MPRPFFGSFILPGEGRATGESCDALERFLRHLYLTTKADGGISHFFFEAQHIAGGGMNINMETVYKLIGLGATVEKFAFQVGGLAYKVHISEWRKHFIGRGGGFKREKIWNEKKKKNVSGKYLPGEDPKELALQRCESYGWHTEVHDEAEACGILDFSLSMIPDYVRPWRDNLLLGGVK
jgi:hypothetical protein